MFTYIDCIVVNTIHILRGIVYNSNPENRSIEKGELSAGGSTPVNRHLAILKYQLKYKNIGLV